GAMLMNNEISTAVKYRVPAIWIVLNDARYNMCFQGMKLLGLTGADALIPETDFVTVARGMGADGVRVTTEKDLDAALEKAIAHNNPFVIDVLIDPTRPAPSKGRNQGLAAQGVKATNPAKHISFPLV
ncbi:thiamine pyrophosphate-binding protein, partial [Nostoc sp. CCCryo 231-06]|nr:thiamine pyrophosphate-binding protein [Nostoc sp. CCCryo 231-06]